LIEESILADLDARRRAEVEAHLERCEKCRRAYRAGVACDEALSVALADFEPMAVPAPSMAKGVSWVSRIYGMRRGLALAGFTAAVFVAGILGYRWTLGLVSPVQAEALDQNEVVHGLGFEEGILAWDGPGGWTGYHENDPHGPAFALIDSTVWHDGHHPLKIFQRNFSGEVHRHFDLPLPEHTTVELGFSALAPKGGTRENKYVSASINTDHQYAATHLMGASNDWLPHSVSTAVAQRSKSLDIYFATVGDGLYYGWNWATWIDDVEIAVILDPGRYVDWWEDDGKVVAQIQLPAPYRNQDIVPGSVHLYPYSSEEFKPVLADTDPTLNARGVYTFSSKPGLALLRGKNPDTGGAITTKICGRVRYGKYELTFHNSLLGRLASADRKAD